MSAFATPTDQLVRGSKKTIRGISPDEIARMEKEMEVVERDYRLHQEPQRPESVTRTEMRAAVAAELRQWREIEQALRGEP